MSAGAAAAGDLDVARVRRTIAALREHLSAAVELLGELYERRAWVTLGLPSWEALCAEELPELAQLLDAAQRRGVVVELRRKGASLRAAAAPVGASPASAKAWCDEAGVVLELAQSLDGRVRPGTAAGTERRTRPRTSTVDRVRALVAEAGEAGLTVHDVARRLRINQCQASATLYRLAGSGRLTYRRPAKRGQTGTYAV